MGSTQSKTFLILGHGAVPNPNMTVFQGLHPVEYLNKTQSMPEDLTFNDPFDIDESKLDDRWNQIKKHTFKVPPNVTVYYGTPPHHVCFSDQEENNFISYLAKNGVDKTLLDVYSPVSGYKHVYESMTQLTSGEAVPNLILFFKTRTRSLIINFLRSLKRILISSRGRFQFSVEKA